MASHTDSVPASGGLLTGISGDLRHAFRLLWKGRGMTATTLLTLALCIGATTAIFSTVYSLMLKPLPFNEPAQIVELYTSAAKAGLNKMPANVPIYLDYSKNASSYEMIALWSFGQQMVGEDQNPVRLDMAHALHGAEDGGAAHRLRGAGAECAGALAGTLSRKHGQSPLGRRRRFRPDERDATHRRHL